MNKNNNPSITINGIYIYYSDNKKYIVTDIKDTMFLSEKYNRYYSVMKLSTYLVLKILPYIMKCIVLYLPFIIFFLSNNSIIITVISIIISIMFDIFIMSRVNITYNGIINKNSVLIPDKEFNRTKFINNELDIPEGTLAFKYVGRCII